ncbi:MAG: MBL fold metallo-hydrolase [Alphaproteobacteria bacterium]|nr:MBL fold metallo-hydrolase [Alphaproteobacteria bacterium]
MTLKIEPILCRQGTMNNYAYVIIDENSGVSAIVDASEADPIVQYCEQCSVIPKYIFTTHHHFDHIGGNMELKEKYGLKIVASDIEKHLIEGVDIALKSGDEFAFGESKIQIISALGHTKGHILYYFADEKVLFTGDVLFNLAIGGLFEGTPEEMFASLEKIKQFPDDVNFYPGHEYTEYGLQRLLHNPTDENMKYLQVAVRRLQQGKSVAPITLGLEKKCNPYLKIDSLKDFVRLF